MERLLSKVWSAKEAMKHRNACAADHLSQRRQERRPTVEGLKPWKWANVRLSFAGAVWQATRP